MKATIIVCDAENINDDILKEAAAKAAEFITSCESTACKEQLENVKKEIRDFTKIADEKYDECNELRGQKILLKEEIQLLTIRKELLMQEAKVKALKPNKPSVFGKIFKDLGNHIASAGAAVFTRKPKSEVASA
jgi:hypothetical protein